MMLPTLLVLEAMMVMLSASSIDNDSGTEFFDTCPVRENEDTEGFTCGSPWAVRNSTGDCSCGHDVHQTVLCDYNASVLGVLDCSCMTYDEELNVTVVGRCMYNCANRTNPGSFINNIYHRIDNPCQRTRENFTREVCGHLHRDGRLCGACETGHYPPVYSYSLECVRCDSHWYNWVKFVVEAFLPLTVFLIIVLTFRISATSAELNAFVMFSQNLVVPANVRTMMASVQHAPQLLTFLKIMATLYGIWNLDFFRTVLPPICLHVTSLQITLLEYAIAFFPLVVLVLAYIAVTLRVHRTRWVGWLCAPMINVLANMRQRWRLKSSIIDAFATFLLLSYVRVLSVTFDLLTFTEVRNPQGNVINNYLYSNAQVKYFKDEHLPYAIAAILIVLVFIILPSILLLLYPMRWFQQCLTRLRLNHELLRTFMDSFQGCYKDGTNGTRDCRYFAAVFLFVRIILFMAYTLTLTVLFYSVATTVLIVLAILIVTVQPYKKQYAMYNKLDAIMALLQAMWCTSVLCINFSVIKGRYFLKFSMVVCGIFSVLPLFYITFVIFHWFYTKSCFRGLTERIQLQRTMSFKAAGSNCDDSDEHRELLESTHTRTSYQSMN